MKLTRLQIFVLLPALMATALVWAVVKRAGGELTSFEGFEGMHLER